MGLTTKLSDFMTLTFGSEEESERVWVPMEDVHEDGTVGLLHSTPEEGGFHQFLTRKVSELVMDEANRQLFKWGVQRHPSFRLSAHEQAFTSAQVDANHYIEHEDVARDTTEFQASRGGLTWMDILKEELAEALGEAYKTHDTNGTSDAVFNELIQVAAVALSWAADVLDKQWGALIRVKVQEKHEEEMAQRESWLADLLSSIGTNEDTLMEELEVDEPEPVEPGVPEPGELAPLPAAVSEGDPDSTTTGTGVGDADDGGTSVESAPTGKGGKRGK